MDILAIFRFGSIFEFFGFSKKIVFLERSVMQLKTTIHVNELVDEMNALKM